MALHINFTPPPGTNRGSVSSRPTWTISALERAKGFPGKHKRLGDAVWFELSKENINYAKMMFPDAIMTGLKEEEDEQRAMVIRPPFDTAWPMDPLQKEAFDLSKDKEYFAFYEKPGSGKTKMLLDAAVRLWCEGKIDGMLIVSPKDVHEQWILDEGPKHITTQL